MHHHQKLDRDEARMRLYHEMCAWIRKLTEIHSPLSMDLQHEARGLIDQAEEIERIADAPHIYR